MSGRKLGGGRILGSGKGLAPPSVAPRASSPMAPSESTVSIGSSSLSPPISGSLPDIGHDIGSSISVGAQPKAGLSSDGGLVCPICNEEMVTLLQLNRHIDDTHQELPAEEQDEVKTWFDKQVLKAKRFQPLSLINQKLRGLEVFESNETVQPTQPPVSHTPGKSQEVHIDPEELITRIHWQRSTGHDRSSQHTTEKPAPATGLVKVDIRMCQDCNHTIFSGRDFDASLELKPADQRAYETLRQFERGIRQLLPSFHRVLLALQPDKLESGEVDLNKPPPTRAQIQEASKIRKRLIDSFGKYGIAAKRIRDLPTQSPTQQRLQTAIYTYASTFLHTNMLPLKSLPQLLRNQSSRSARSAPHLPVHSASGLRHTELAESDTASQAASEASTVVSQLETEEKGLREGLAVLEEQRFMVEEMLRAATRARRFEEISALNRNMDELEAEINALKGKITSVESRWEGVYRDGLPS
ncbi:hypothetical protein MY10362_001492 [Beauveria mimosiformis]